MAYVVTANRLMGICAFEPGTKNSKRELSPKTVVQQFNKQMEGITEHRLDEIFGAIESEIKQRDFRLLQLGPDEDDLDVSILQGSGKNVNSKIDNLFGAEPDVPPSERERDPIVGLFRSRHYHLKMPNMTWDLRIRPSVTACVLERADRISKLWWTFEGVPTDATQPPTKEASIDFAELTTELAQKALGPLRDAYIDALGDEKRPRRLTEVQLRVTLADNTDTEFSKLVDAMYFTAVSFKSAVDGKRGDEVKKGALEVLHYIRKAGGHEPETVRISSGGPGTAAVYSMPMLDSDPGSAKHYVVAGLASSVNMLTSNLPTGDEWIRKTNSPGAMRSMSAARRVSALVANQGARELDNKTRYSLSNITKRSPVALANG
jgi:hypothetical protein